MAEEDYLNFLIRVQRRPISRLARVDNKGSEHKRTAVQGHVEQPHEGLTLVAKHPRLHQQEMGDTKKKGQGFL
eukprot:12412968-Heterocapsa_arctica.AAC.1